MESRKGNGDKLFFTYLFIHRYCERCDKKVDALKSLSFFSLPPLLTFQLKRFDYEYHVALLSFHSIVLLVVVSSSHLVE